MNGVMSAFFQGERAMGKEHKSASACETVSRLSEKIVKNRGQAERGTTPSERMTKSRLPLDILKVRSEM
ncbi:MAG: hypothetical protein AB1546_12940 [bacterium]